MTLDDSYREMCLEVEALRAERDRLLDELAEANARRGDLRTALEWANEERDEARAEIAGLPAWQKGCEQALGDLADAEEAIARLYTERDEARAEVERLRAEAASSLAMARIAGDKHDQKCAEVDVLRGVGCEEDGDGSCGVCRKCAYRRGAEAMREACAREASVCANHRGEELDAILSALPIPEEP